MCEFVSWIETPGKRGPVILFLSAEALATPKGLEIAPDDRLGHGAIRQYYGLAQDEGTNHECVDFSSPSNFPAEIVRALKRGEFRGLGTPKGLLSAATWAEYQQIRQTALAEYEQTRQPAYAEYERVRQPALAEYQQACQPAYAEYQRADRNAFWDLWAVPANRSPAWGKKAKGIT